MPRRPTIRVGAALKPERKGSEVHFRKPFRNSFPSNKLFPNSGNAFPEKAKTRASTGDPPRFFADARRFRLGALSGRADRYSLDHRAGNADEYPVTFDYADRRITAAGL